MNAAFSFCHHPTRPATLAGLVVFIPSAGVISRYNDAMTTTLRARFDGNVLVPIGPVDLPTDRELEIEVSDPAKPIPGTAAAILEALRTLPKLSAEDVDALERSIEEGKLPVRDEGIFDDLRE